MAKEESSEESLHNMLDAEPHAQAVELIGFIASECASFFGGIADTVKRYENTGELPKGSIVHGVPEKAKIGKAGRPKAKGEKKEQKAKGPKKPPSTFNCFVRDHINFMQQESAARRAQEDADVKAGRIAAPSEAGKPTDNFKEAVAVWSRQTDAEKAAYKDKLAKAAAAEAAAKGEPATMQSPTKQEPAASGPAPPASAATLNSPAAATGSAPAAATPGAESEKKKKKRKRKPEQAGVASSMPQSAGPETDKKKKKKKKHAEEA